jgi:hypothetical protein
MIMLFTALHESGIGPYRRSAALVQTLAVGRRSEWRTWGRIDTIDPNRTLSPSLGVFYLTRRAVCIFSDKPVRGFLRA